MRTGQIKGHRNGWAYIILKNGKPEEDVQGNLPKATDIAKTVFGLIQLLKTHGQKLDRVETDLAFLSNSCEKFKKNLSVKISTNHELMFQLRDLVQHYSHIEFHQSSSLNKNCVESARKYKHYPPKRQKPAPRAKAVPKVAKSTKVVFRRPTSGLFA